MKFPTYAIPTSHDDASRGARRPIPHACVYIASVDTAICGKAEELKHSCQAYFSDKGTCRSTRCPMHYACLSTNIGDRLFIVEPEMAQVGGWGCGGPELSPGSGAIMGVPHTT